MKTQWEEKDAMGREREENVLNSKYKCKQLYKDAHVSTLTFK